MNGNEKLERYLQKYPHAHRTFSQRPHWSRREFFELAGAGVVASFLPRRAFADGVSQAAPQLVNKAKNVIFILLTGAPAHVDTFDLKELSGTTPADFQPTTVNGIRWPMGLLPGIGGKLNDIVIVRSMRAWALVHSLGQSWVQIGRNPAAALGDIAPNIGSIVALEKEKDRLPSQVFPTFLALNAQQSIGSGYLSTKYAPFKVTPASGGLSNVTNPDGQTRLDDRWSLLHQLDDPLRKSPAPNGKPMEDMDSFYSAAKGLTYNPVVNTAFSFSAPDSMRYGNSGIGNSCLVAKQVLTANQGTRYIEIMYGGWDMHQNIYDRNTNPRGNLYTISKPLDDAVAALLTDLKSTGLLDQTLVVMGGEFGRTTGKLNPANGRDHWPQQFVMFAGAGVKGGRVIGATNADGSATADPGWSQGRDVKPEDVEATIYSALGIDYTYVNYNDPFHRGFEYVPGGKDGVYAPITELWG